ncbi:MAG: hypothetical protein IJ627_00475 [Bacteroidales bacterium]|nr:hypothetical protein [Bacteroidales bacterium]
MVGFIDIHSLTLDELSGVVNLYPWYGAARIELCRRMGQAWSAEEFAAHALYVADRGKIASLAKVYESADYHDTTTPDTTDEPEAPAVHVVGGDYFSQTQYDSARRSGDGIFSRLAVGDSPAPGADNGQTTDIADLFTTETLASIFVEQGRTEEARRIYSRLILDIPEKSAYFASLIDKLN